MSTSQYIPQSSGGYVKVSTVTRVASELALVSCVLSLSLWLLTGFAAIHPSIALLLIVLAVGFHAMADRLEQTLVRQQSFGGF